MNKRKTISYTGSPIETRDAWTLRWLRFIHHPELRGSGGGLGLIGQGDTLQKDEKSRCLVNRCLLCHGNKSFWSKPLSLVIALLLVQVLSQLLQVVKGEIRSSSRVCWAGDCRQFIITHVTKWRGHAAIPWNVSIP